MWRTTSSVVLFTLQLYASDTLDQLIWRNPLPTGNNFEAIAFGNGLFVAVAGPEIWTSANGLDWTLRASHTTNTLRDVVFAQNRFVVVGNTGTVSISSNGTEWATHPSLVSGDLAAVTFGGDRYLVVSTTAAYYSTDALDWNLALSRPFGGFRPKAAYGSGRFVIVDGNSMVSTDAVSWSTNSLGNYFEPSAFGYGNGLFLAAGGFWSRGSRFEVILTSTNGINWQSTSSSRPIRAVGFGPDLFITAGFLYSPVPTGFIQTSADGLQWAIQSTNVTSGLADIAYGGSRFVAVGSSGSIVISTNGLDWFAVSMGDTRTILSVAFGHAGYIAVGSVILGSRDGFGYSLVSTNFATDVAYGNNAYAATAGSSVLESPNGAQWNLRNSGSRHALYDVHFANSTFVAVGSFGTIQTSPNARAWSGRFSGSTHSLFCATYGNNKWVVVGEFGTILTSADTLTWTGQYSDSLSLLRSVAYGNGLFVAVGDAGAILTSHDGETWTVRVSGVSADLHSVAFGLDTFVATGNMGNQFLSSSDGINWGLRPLPASGGYPYPRVAFVNDTFMFVGAGGMILQTPSDTIALSGQRSGEAFEVTVRGGYPGAILELQKRTIFDGAAWEPLLIFTNALPYIKVQDAAAAGTAFYRVLCSRP